MKRKLAIFFLLLMLPFMLVILVNELPNNQSRTTKQMKEYCTLDCHNNSCKHWEKSYRESPTAMKKIHKDIFDTYVNMLSAPAGISYRSTNLLVFFLFYPMVGSLLLWNLIRRV